MPRTKKRIGRQHGARPQAKGVRQDLITRTLQPFDVHLIEPRLADRVPRTQRADLVVEHEQTGAEHQVCVLVVAIAGDRLSREIRGIRPAAVADRCGDLDLKEIYRYRSAKASRSI